MNDGSGFDAPDDDEPVLIDARSPGERLAESGRARVERVQSLVRAEPLGIAAVCWMVGLVVVLATEGYSAFRLGIGGGAFGGNEIWFRLEQFSGTAGFGVAGAALIGLALGALAGTSRSRSAYRTGVLIGVWVMVANVCGLAAAIHGYGIDLNPFYGNRVVQGIAACAFIGLGLIVVLIARGLLRADGPNDPPGVVGEPQIAELS